MQVARSSPSRFWVAYIVTIDEAHEFFQRTEEITARNRRVPPMFITMHMLVVFGAVWNMLGR